MLVRYVEDGIDMEGLGDDGDTAVFEVVHAVIVDVMVLRGVLEDEDLTGVEGWVVDERMVEESGWLVELGRCWPTLKTISYTAAATRPPQVLLGSP